MQSTIETRIFLATLIIAIPYAREVLRLCRPSRDVACPDSVRGDFGDAPRAAHVANTIIGKDFDATPWDEVGKLVIHPGIASKPKA